MISTLKKLFRSGKKPENASPSEIGRERPTAAPAAKKESEPVRLDTDSHLKKFVRLSDPPSSKTSILPMVGDRIYYPFDKTTDYGSVNGHSTSAQIFGIGEIDVGNDFGVTAHRLPVGLPKEEGIPLANVRFTGLPMENLRHACLEAVSGTDLIYRVRGPMKQETYAYNHHLFAFETGKKNWSRILRGGPGGTYRKQSLPQQNSGGDYPPDSPANAYITTKSERMAVWSTGPGKLEVETNEERFDKRYEYLRAFEKSMYSGYYNSDRPLELKCDEYSIGIRFEIRGIGKLLGQKDDAFKNRSTGPGESISVVHEGSVLFPYGSKHCLGVFITYYLPRR